MNSAVIVDAERYVTRRASVAQPRAWSPIFTGHTVLQSAELERLDKLFLLHLGEDLRERLLAYRRAEGRLPATEVSELLLACAPVLEQVIAESFGIEEQLRSAYKAAFSQARVFEFKALFVQKRARKRATQASALEPFTVLDAWLGERLSEARFSVVDRELAVARFALDLLSDEAAHADSIERLTCWCISALSTPEGRQAVAGWVSFKLPQPYDHEQLVPIEFLPGDAAGRFQGPRAAQRPRDGFKLTDRRMSEREVLNEVHYCVQCHENRGDFCSKGFPKKPRDPAQGLKVNPLGVTLTGCPLEEKISEMQVLKKDGHTIAALAMVMVDNPMCPATGHRICNDCMKACVYQKQEPVNIPQVETRCLTDVLALPWGVEIYDLLTRWNPLRARQWLPKPYNGLKVMVCGLGPAGFTLAHHLLMEGFAVVGIDGLKLEPLPAQLINGPIKDYKSFEEELDARVINGFGGVGESGITVRWDKNFLKLIYLTLARREHFQCFGGVRFGGTMTLDEAWSWGFDHLAIAVGSGLSQALPIPGSLAIGMRQASDFLMSLQLSGAARPNSLATLQVRMPALVIGGGLTGIDAATEVQAYYIAQVEKVLARHEALSAESGEQAVRGGLDEASLAILDEFLEHGRAIRAERERARKANQSPNFIPLIQRWGGVTVAYRRGLRDSPAYIRNHEEVSKAFEEGLYYGEGLEPKAATLDEFGHIAAMRFAKQTRNDAGQWAASGEEVVLPARTVLVATGARPNVAYEFEHRGNFKKDAVYYQAHQEAGGELRASTATGHVKTPGVGVFTSYDANQKRVSYVGDTHPVFHGSVVNAIASAARAYPEIVAHFGARTEQAGDAEEYAAFRSRIDSALRASVVAVKRLGPQWLELIVRAPLAAQRFRPGQFFALQLFETQVAATHPASLRREALTLTGSKADRVHGTISFLVRVATPGGQLISGLHAGDPVTLMGPTGVRSRIGEGETVMIVTEGPGLAHIRATGPALREKGCRVLHVALLDTAEDVCLREDFEAAADATVWITSRGQPVSKGRATDRAATGEAVQILRDYAAGGHGTPPIPLQEVQQLLILGSSCTVRMFKQACAGELAPLLERKPAITASVSTPIQCGLKGVCAQCLHWQVDPSTGQRTKAVFGCSWQDQPLAMVDLDNVEARLGQNRLQEHLTDLWIGYLEAQQAERAPQSQACLA